jgi:hypothetical protein
MTETEDGIGTPEAFSENSFSIYVSNFKAEYVLHTDLFNTKNFEFVPQNVRIVFPTALRIKCNY